MTASPEPEINIDVPIDSSRFLVAGYLGPTPIISSDDCSQLRKSVRRAARNRRLVWRKALATVSRPVFELAIHPRIIDLVSQILGDQIMLWGASLESRAPRAKHPWHTDIETATRTGKTVSVWLALCNTSQASSLMLVPNSHSFGRSLQEERKRHGVDRGKVTRDNVVEWAKAHNPLSRVVQPYVPVGSALLFDGQLWHASHNTSEMRREALLLQYATPDTEIRIPDLRQMDWPFEFLASPLPPCIMVRGSGNNPNNKFVSPPSASNTGVPGLSTAQFHPVTVPIPRSENHGWVWRHFFRGSTSNHDQISCHASSLAPGVIPHPPHVHDEEELLLLLDGTADLILPGLDNGESASRIPIKPGQFVYYPANFRHTLVATGDRPASYLMFKWQTTPVASGTPLPYSFFDANSIDFADGSSARFKAKRLFEGPTNTLKKLHAHVSRVAPGGGYQTHVDAHDVAIVLFEGEIECLGARHRTSSVIYIPAGQPHGMRNVGDAEARYLVFEFHGHNSDLQSVNRSRSKIMAARTVKFVRRVTDLRRWQRKFLRISDRQ